LPCGSYTITATVDPDDLLCECSSANNVKDATFTVVDPDLTLTDLSVLCQGDGSFRVTATVRNVGTEASPATTARIYVDGVLAGSLAIPELPIGGMHPISWSSNRIKCGVDHLFRLVVDEANAICECQEGNNEVLTAARCGCPALVTDKAIAQILRAGVPVPTHSPVQPGDVITYTLQVTNVGTGWAFDVDLWDVLPVEFLYVLGSTSATWPGGSSTADPAGAPGPNLAWDLSATLRPGETLTLQFQAFVTSLARQDFRYTNAMRATGTEGDGTPIPPDSGLPGDTDPDDSDEVVHPAAVPALSLDKAIADVLRGGASRGPAGPVEPGDVIVYTVTIRNVGYGVAYDVDFTDELPAHVEYETAYGDGTYTVDSPAASGSLGIPDGATGLVTADISATVNPGGTLVANYRVRVLSSAAQGVDLVNRAATTGKDGAGNPIPEYNPDIPDPYPDRDSTRIGVVEPGLALDKEIVDVLRGGVSIWPTPIVLWGDVIVYRVSVRNVGLGTAYDVDLTDTLPYGLAYDAGGDGTWTVDNPPASGTLGIPDGATGTIVADISATLAAGGTLIARYRARVTPEAVPGSWLENFAVVAGKDGAGMPIPEFNSDVDDDYPDRDETRIRVGAPALVTGKQYYCEPCDPCAPEPSECTPCPKEPIGVRVGETVRFRLTVTNVGYSHAYSIVVEDRLPKGFEYVRESAVLTWPGGRVQLEPVAGEDSVLTWITGLSLDAGESLAIVFAARVTDKAVVDEEVVNVMHAEGVDAFNVAIPPDSSMFVPEDTDLEDTARLRLKVLAPETAGVVSEGGRSRRLAGVALLGVAGLGGLLGVLRRSRFLGMVFLLLLASAGFLTFAGETRYTVVLVSDPPRAGTLFGAGTYKAGEFVQVSALPNRGFEFVGWFEDSEEISPTPFLEFTAERNRRLIARFRPVFDFVGLSSLSRGNFSFLPSTALESMRVELRSRYKFGFNPWDFRAVAVFAEDDWRDAQFHCTGAWDKVHLGGGLLFDLTEPAYRSAYGMLSFSWDELRVGLRVTHYRSYGTPPAPALISNLTLDLPHINLAARFEEKDALAFEDLTLSFYELTPCCDISVHSTLFLAKAGFSYLRLTVTNVLLGCCDLRADLSVTITADAKSVEFTPRWIPYCDACLTLYGDVLWDSEEYRFEGLALYGYKLRCCFGQGCCPQGPGGYVEVLTAFEPNHVPGGFYENEFEYLKLGFCGLGCCGGTYTVDITFFFRDTGGLFGFSRVLAAASIPLAAGLKIEPRLEIPVAGEVILSFGWNFRF
ncbi:MAG: hypothetical protein NZ651_04570, partial [Candidatus Bipolaricaulota bacterium]|nr:hypothetical protein [Candidatus Bipolaricaulota bacterium]MDW8127026.1 CARDB domain-containing protein [Candidatus Bipolaricaulota bacterium]